MSIDFFDGKCKSVTNEAFFVICDDRPLQPAYINSINFDNGIAKVVNENSIEIEFFAIDNCIEIRRQDNTMSNRCDGMLFYKDNIVFVELKKERTNWISDGIIQLKNTIVIFANNHDLSLISKRRAYLANKKHPNFHYSHKDEMTRFKNETGVRLLIDSTITI